jgi:STE24 endopeptidase
MAKSHGIPAENVYWFDASRQSNRISANVSGMFGTTRISLNDNLLERTSPETVKAVLGHEMGHYVLGHMYTQVAFLAVMLFLGFAFVRWAFGRVLSRFGERWSVRGIGDVAGLPLVIALFSVFSFAVTPIDNTMTRIAEEQADAFGLDAAREPDGFAQAAVLLAEYRKMRPGPVEEALFHDHPSGWNRIRRAMEWKARNLDAKAAGAPVQGAAAP